MHFYYLFNVHRFSETVKAQVLAGGQEAMLSSPKALQFITNITGTFLETLILLSNISEKVSIKNLRVKKGFLCFTLYVSLCIYVCMCVFVCLFRL